MRTRQACLDTCVPSDISGHVRSNSKDQQQKIYDFVDVFGEKCLDFGGYEY
jgi:hypothetical protein